MIGVVAIAIGLYMIKKNSDNNSKLKAHVLADYTTIDKNAWPKPRKIIDINAK